MAVEGGIGLLIWLYAPKERACREKPVYLQTLNSLMLVQVPWLLP